MKRQKKIFALLAAIQMMASLLSIGAAAEGATEREENLRNITYLAVANTYIYASQGGNGTATSVSKKAQVSSSRSMTSWQSIVVGSGDHWPDASRGGGNVKRFTALGEGPVNLFSDRSSTLLASTKGYTGEHLLFQRRICREGEALLIPLRKRRLGEIQGGVFAYVPSEHTF